LQPNLKDIAYVKYQRSFLVVFSLLITLSFTKLFAHDGHDGHDDHHHHDSHEHAAHEHEHDGGDKPFDPVPMIMHHIADANEFHVAGDFSIPLPVIVYSRQTGLDIFMSSKLKHGHAAYNRYVIDHGVVGRIMDESFPMGHVEDVHVHHGHAEYNGHHYDVTNKYTLLNGSEAFYDFSITKNVFTLFLAIFILLGLFVGMGSFYQKGNKIPKGIYSALEPIIIFVRDDIALTNIGKEKYMKFLPYLLTVFFFIWIINLLGLVPFFPGSANLTGNISLTVVLALITLIITNVNGSKYYWGHLFNPPVPGPLKVLMVPIELIGIFTKPFALMIRLFANITAGHILILSLLSLIFIFKSFALPFVSVPFVIFMTFLELLVAFLQAYIFTLLSALFIGLAVEDHH
jgi:F-type H+-transporting ATPase subunit a